MASKSSPVRSGQTVQSPARSRYSGRMSTIINDSLLKHSVLSDNTDVDTIERSRWWEILGDQSQNVMEVLERNKYDTSKTDEFASKGNDPNNFLNELGVEVLSQEKHNYSLALPESSDNETIHSIIIPERRVFNQKEKTKPKMLGKLIGARETLANNQPRKSQGFDLKAAARQKQIFGQGPVKNTGSKIAALINLSNKSNDEDINNKRGKKYFDDTILSKTKPAFPSALLDVSHDKTVPNKDKTIESKLKPLFGQNKVKKRNNMYAQFIASESEDELPEVEPKSFAIPKSSTSLKRPSSAVFRGRDSSPASVTTDVEMDEWNMLPSSTMMEEQIKLATPVKRVKLGKLSEIHKIEASPYNTRSAKKSLDVSNPANDNTLSITTNKKNRTSKFVGQDPIREENEDTLKENKTFNKSEKEVNVTVDKKGKDTSKSMNKTTSKAKDESIKQMANITRSNKEATSETEDNEEMVLRFEDDNEQQNIPDKNKESSAIDNIELIAQLTGQEVNEDSSNKSGKGSTTAVINKENKIVDETADEIYDEVLEEMGLNNTEVVNNQSLLSQNKTSKIDKTVSLKENISKISAIPQESITFSEELEKKKYVSQINKDLGTDTNTENDQNVNNTNVRQDVTESINKLQDNIISKPEQTKPEILQMKDQNEEKNEVHNQSKNISKQTIKTIEDVTTSKTENEESINQSKIDEVPTELEQEDEQEDIQSEKAISESEQEPEQSEEELNYDESEEEKEESEVIAEDEDDPDDNDATNNSDVDNVSESEQEPEQSEKELNYDESEEEKEESEVIEEDEDDPDDNDATNNSDVNNVSEIRNKNSQVDENQETEGEMDKDNKDVFNASEENDSRRVEEGADDDLENSEEIEEQDERQESENNMDVNQETDDERDMSQEQETSQGDDEHEDSQEIEHELDNCQEQNTSQENRNIEPKENEISKYFEAIDEESETNVTHDTTGSNRQKRNASIIASPELARSETSIRNSSFKANGRNTSVRKTVTLIQKPETEMASVRSSVGLSDGTKNSSAEGSGWDSHRVTKKTLRQTFGKDFTPRKSLRTLVMEKSAKRQTLAQLNQANQAVDNVKENVTEVSMPQAVDVEDLVESDHDVSKMTRQATLDMFLKKMKEDAAKKKQKAESKVKESLDMGIQARLKSSSHNWAPVKSYSKPSFQPAKPKLKPKKLAIPIAHLPKGFLDDINYKPPKRFAPKNASWITNRLYKFLESKLEPKYDYSARVHAEKFVKKLYDFVQVARRHDIAPQYFVDELKQEMAALCIVQTHFDFYEFFEDYLPMEIILSVVPDIKNKIKLPRGGVYTNILKQD